MSRETRAQRQIREERDRAFKVLRDLICDRLTSISASTGRWRIGGVSTVTGQRAQAMDWTDALEG